MKGLQGPQRHPQRCQQRNSSLGWSRGLPAKLQAHFSFNQPILYCLRGCGWARGLCTSLTEAHLLQEFLLSYGKRNCGQQREDEIKKSRPPGRLAALLTSVSQSARAKLIKPLPHPFIHLLHDLSSHLSLIILSSSFTLCSSLREGGVINICPACYLIHYGIVVNLIWWYFLKKIVMY